MNLEVNMKNNNISALEETDQIYSTLVNHAITLSEVYEKEKNYISLAWVLISGDRTKFFEKKVKLLIDGMKQLSDKYIKEKKINTNLFISLAVTCYICKQHKKQIPSKIRQAISEILNELKRNRRLRSVEMVGTILYFLHKSDNFKREVTDLKDYLQNELRKVIKAGKYVQIIDAYFGLFQTKINTQYYEQILANKKLLDVERLAKTLITLSIAKNSLKDKVFIILKEEFKEKYFLKLDMILQAVINGLSLVESNLSEEEVHSIFRSLKEKEWTKFVDLEKNELKVKRISPDIIKILNPRLIGLSLIAFSEANRKIRFSLNSDQYKELKSAWKEKKFGFGLNVKHFKFFYYFSLIFMIILLLIVIYSTNLTKEIISGFACIRKEGLSCIVSLSLQTIAILIIIGVIITYHRAYKLITKEGEFKSVWEIVWLFPIIGTIIKKISGEK